MLTQLLAAYEAAIGMLADLNLRSHGCSARWRSSASSTRSAHVSLRWSSMTTPRSMRGALQRDRGSFAAQRECTASDCVLLQPA